MHTTATRPALAIANADASPARREQLRATIARLGGYCDWSLDSSGWVVTLYLPQERTFAGPTLEAALAACAAWLISATTSGPHAQHIAGHTARGARAHGD